EGPLQTRRPCITTNWITDADDFADIVDRGRAGCVCGCFIEVGDILKQALRETRQGPVQAVVIVGDFHGDLDAAVATAKKLRAAGTRVFLFQQGRSGRTEDAFRALAQVTGGAYHQFNPHVEQVGAACRGYLRRSPISLLAAWQLWKREATSPLRCCSNRCTQRTKRWAAGGAHDDDEGGRKAVVRPPPDRYPE